MPFKLWATLGLVAAILGGLTYHKVVVGQRDHARSQVVALDTQLNKYRASLTESEERRVRENEAAKQALKDARIDADARVKEARRSAGAIKKIVEKPHATNPQTGCPVPDIVSNGELRDALQPAPFGAAPAPEPSPVPGPETGAAPSSWSDPGAALSGPAGDGGLPQLGVGGAGVGEGAGPWSGATGQLPGV